MGNECCRQREDGEDGLVPVRMLPAISAENARSLDGRMLLEIHTHEHPSEGYKITDAVLGTGHFGDVVQVHSKRTGAICALKSIGKDRAMRQFLRNELEVCVEINHPNIVRLLDVYEDNLKLYLIFEMCKGGELLHALMLKRTFREQEALSLMGQVLWAVNYLHQKCISHRDIKMENLLLKEQQLKDISKVTLKLCDFGHARRFEKGNASFHTRVGSAMYVAPEVLVGMTSRISYYTEKCDIWSAGVVSYILFTSTAPFTGHTDAEILRAVVGGRHHPDERGARDKVSFPTRAWRHVHMPTKELVRSMMTRSVRRRLNAEAAVAAWTDIPSRRDSHYASTATGSERDHESPSSTGDSFMHDYKLLYDDLLAYCTKNRFEKYARHLVARNIEDHHVGELRSQFRIFDANSNGTINLDELKREFLSADVADASKLEELFLQLDSNGDGTIDYTEFLAAVLQDTHMAEECALREAFAVIDVNDDGEISAEDIVAAFSAKDCTPMGLEEAKSFLAEADKDFDGRVGFSDFLRMVNETSGA